MGSFCQNERWPPNCGRRTGFTIAIVLEAIPPGAEVHIALSETMRELGITAEIDQSGRYDSIRARLMALDRTTQGRQMAKLGAAPDQRYLADRQPRHREKGPALQNFRDRPGRRVPHPFHGSSLHF